MLLISHVRIKPWTSMQTSVIYTQLVKVKYPALWNMSHTHHSKIYTFPMFILYFESKIENFIYFTLSLEPRTNVLCNLITHTFGYNSLFWPNFFFFFFCLLFREFEHATLRWLWYHMKFWYSIHFKRLSLTFSNFHIRMHITRNACMPDQNTQLEFTILFNLNIFSHVIFVQPILLKHCTQNS